jgi:GNAT superfamily N-acetyltransferase
MIDDDTDFAVSLTDREGWGYLPTDFKRFMEIEPQGCFVALDNGAYAGIITTISYGDYAFVGSLIVHPGNRGKGIGEALLRRALDYLRGKNIRSIELDGTFPAVALYRRLGFKDKYLSLRFVRPGNQDSCPEGIAWTTPAVDNWKTAILDMDQRLTGLNRGRLLSHIAAESRRSIYVHPSESPSGYARVYLRADNRLAIGPIIARDAATAADLWDIILERYDMRPIAVGIPEMQRSAILVACRRGFLYRPPSLRMYLGDKIDYESSVYAIVSADKG